MTHEKILERALVRAENERELALERLHDAREAVEDANAHVAAARFRLREALKTALQSKKP